MYHQLNRVTGRLVASHLQNPLFPIAPVALQRVDPPAIQYNTNHLSTVADACPAPRTKLIPGTNTPYAPLSEKIRQKQALFQKEDDVPVFLKGGPLDAILYRFTMALCIAGLFGVGHTIFSHAIPKN